MGKARGTSRLGEGVLLGAVALLGGWGALLLARSARPAPPLPPYEIPAVSPDEPLPEAPREGLAERQVLVFNNGVEPQTLDPTLMTALPELTIALGLFEGLTSLHPKTLAPVPGVAERWEVSPDGRRYVFHLRAARWSDGGALTADDFVYSWRRALRPQTGAQYAQMLHCFENARAFNEGKLRDETEPGFRALDPLTLEVRLEHPVPFFLELAAFATLCPVPRGRIEARGEQWTRPESLVCNGPFTLAEWRPQERIVLRKNPRYWNAARVALSEVHVLAIDDSDTALKKYLNGEVDWIRDVPAPKVAQAARMPGFRYYPQLGTYFFRLNVGRWPLSDPRVRQALNLAIDKEAIARHLLRAGQRAARGLVPPILRAYPPVDGGAHDAARARELLAEAGFPDGRGFPRLSLLYNSSEAHQQIAEAVQHMWLANLGIRVTLLNQEWKVFLDSVAGLQYDISRGSWIGDYADPSTFLECFVTGSGNNRTGWSHAGYDGLVARAAREADPAARLALLRQAEELLVTRELPVIPLYFFVNAYLVRPKVRGVENNIRNFHPFQYIWIAAD